MSNKKTFPVVGERRADGDVPKGETIGSDQLDIVWDIVHDSTLKTADRVLLLRYWLLAEGGMAQTTMAQNKEALGVAYNTARNAHTRLKKAGLVGKWTRKANYRVGLPVADDRVVVKRVNRCTSCAGMAEDLSVLKRTLHLLVKQGTEGQSCQELNDSALRAGGSSRKNILTVYKKDKLSTISKLKSKQQPHQYAETFEEFNRLRREHGGGSKALVFKAWSKKWVKAHALCLGDSNLLLKAWRMVLTSKDHEWWLKTRGLALADTFLREKHLSAFLLEAEGWDEPSVEDRAKLEHRATQVSAMASLENTSDSMSARMWVIHNRPWVESNRRKGIDHLRAALIKKVSSPELVLEHLKLL